MHTLQVSPTVSKKCGIADWFTFCTRDIYIERNGVNLEYYTIEKCKRILQGSIKLMKITDVYEVAKTVRDFVVVASGQKYKVTICVVGINMWL